MRLGVSSHAVAKERGAGVVDSATHTIAGDDVDEGGELAETDDSHGGLAAVQYGEVDAWEDALDDFIRGVAGSATGRQQMPAEALWNALSVPIERRDRFGAKRISEIMQRRGFTRTNVRDKDRVVTGYVRQTTPNYFKYQDKKAEDSDM